MRFSYFFSKQGLLFTCMALAMTIGLLACEKDEDFIPEPSEIILNTGPEFDEDIASEEEPDTTGGVVNFLLQKGSLIPLDDQLNIVDSMGNIIQYKHDDDSRYPCVVLYEHADFKYKAFTIYSNNTSGVYSLSFSALQNIGLTYRNWRGKKSSRISSIVVAPYNKVTLYGGNDDYTQTIAGYSTLESAEYVKYLGSSNDRALSIRIDVTNYNFPRKRNLCGFLYQHDRYRGKALPYFYQTPISSDQLNNWSWNNQISSVSLNAYSDCNNVVLVDGNLDEHAGRAFNAKGDAQFLPGFNDNVHSIIPDGEYGNRSKYQGLARSQFAGIFNTHKEQHYGQAMARKNYQLTYDQKKAYCSAFYKECESAIAHAIDVTDIFYAAACPEFELPASIVEGVIDVDHGDYLGVLEDVAAEVVGLAAAIPSVAAWIVEPEVKAAACYSAGANILARGGTAIQCSTATKDFCNDALGIDWDLSFLE